MLKVEEHLKKEQQAKKDKEEADRQMIMLKLADKETSQRESQQQFQSSDWNWSKPDISSVRKADLDKLPTPVPQLQKGVSMRYVYPELPNYVEKQSEVVSGSASGSRTSSNTSYQKCQSNEDVVNKKIEKMGALYSKLLPPSGSNKNLGYSDLVSDLMHCDESEQKSKRIQAMADYELTESEEESPPPEII